MLSSRNSSKITVEPPLRTALQILLGSLIALPVVSTLYFSYPDSLRVFAKWAAAVIGVVYVTAHLVSVGHAYRWLSDNSRSSIKGLSNSGQENYRRIRMSLQVFLVATIGLLLSGLLLAFNDLPFVRLFGGSHLWVFILCLFTIPVSGSYVLVTRTSPEEVPMPETVVVIKQKSPGAATVFSFFWPGLGQIYNGQIFKGLCFGFIHLCCSLITTASLLTSPFTASNTRSFGLGISLASAAAIVAFWIYGMWDARRIAEAYNANEHIGPWRGLLGGLAWLVGVWFIGSVLSTIPTANRIVHNTVLPVRSGVHATPTSSRSATPLPEQPREQDYISQVHLENIQVTEGYGQFDIPGYSSQKPIVKATLRNTGTRSLT